MRKDRPDRFGALLAQDPIGGGDQLAVVEPIEPRRRQSLFDQRGDQARKRARVVENMPSPACDGRRRARQRTRHADGQTRAVEPRAHQRELQRYVILEIDVVVRARPDASPGRHLRGADALDQLAGERLAAARERPVDAQPPDQQQRPFANRGRGRRRCIERGHQARAVARPRIGEPGALDRQRGPRHAHCGGAIMAASA